jgi:sirohydrochlorin cobaltochelatase
MTISGLILFAHGARDPVWAEPFEKMAQLIKAAQPELPVVLSYLEFMTPSLQEAGHQLLKKGCTKIVVVPLFLGAGGHVRKDLPQLMQELKSQSPQVNWLLQPAIGLSDEVIQAMAHAALKQVAMA